MQQVFNQIDPKSTSLAQINVTEIVYGLGRCICRVITCMENPEMFGILTAVSEMSGILLIVREKWPKTVYC